MSYITHQTVEYYTTNLGFLIQNSSGTFNDFDNAKIGIPDVISILQSHKDLFSKEESYPYKDFIHNLGGAIISEITGTQGQTLSNFSELINSENSATRTISKGYLLKHRESIINFIGVFVGVILGDVYGYHNNPDIASELFDTRDRSIGIQIELLILIDLQLGNIFNIDMSKRISYKELREKYTQLPDPIWMSENFKFF